MAGSIPAASVDRSDLSIQFFDRIFGAGWETLGTLISNPPAAGSGTAPSMIYAIMEHFNAVALVAMGFMWAWMGWQAALGSAHEGTPLGKRFHSLWVPMRWTFAAAGLAPVVNGLSLAQLFVLSAIGFSVQTANTVWEKGLEYFVSAGGQVVLSVPPVVEEQGQALASGILRSLTIQMWRIDRQGETFPGTVYIKSFAKASAGDGNDTASSGSRILTFATPTSCDGADCGLSPGDFGSIEIPCQAEGDAICVARENAIEEMTTKLSTLALKLASQEKVTRAEQLQVMDAAVHTYTLRTVAALRASVAEAQGALSTDLANFKDSAAMRGWMMAGSYYWTITRLNEKALEALRDDTAYNGPDERKFARGMLPEFEGLDASVKSLTAEQMKAAQAGSDDGGWARVRQKINEIVSVSVINGVTKAVSSTDIVAAFAALGHTIIAAVEAVFALVLALYAASGAATGFTNSAVGAGVSALTGGALGAVTKALSSVLAFVAPGLWGLMLGLFVAGFVFAYYIPALPYILWVSALVGWFIVVVETIIAAPLWVVVHSLPEGEGVAGQRAQQGYTMLLGILLRPPLMVAGMLCAYAMIQGLGPVVGYTFTIFHASLGADHIMGLPHIFATLTILCSLMMIMSHKLFGLISWLPEHVIRWIGGGAASLGEMSDEGRARAIFAGIGTRSEGILAKAGSPARGVGGGIGKGKGLGNEKAPDGGAGGHNDHLQGKVGSPKGGYDE
jgi:conjugal transfer/type IV secretion protein DotA/TraY